jgi:hypothetical protein
MNTIASCVWTIPPSAIANYNQENGVEVIWNEAYAFDGVVSCQIVDNCGHVFNLSVNVATCCSLDANITIQQPCNGLNTGFILANPINGTQPYKYEWSQGIFSNSLNNLAPGTYDLVVTDNNGCMDIQSIVLNPSTSIVLSVASSYACTNINNGSVGVNVTSGGFPPFNYAWTSYGNNQILTNVGVGTYNVTVTDNNHCSTSTYAVVSSWPTNLPAPIVTGSNSACNGAQLYTIINYNSIYNDYYNWIVNTNSGSYSITHPNGNKQTALIQWPSSGGRIDLNLGIIGCMQSSRL